jgi:predicted permease
MIRRFVLRLLSFLRFRRAEAELARELAAHLQLLEDQFVAQRMSAGDARDAARRAFGSVELAKERQRDARSFRWLDGAALDFKLGARMLVRYPGLTLVGGLALAAAIAVGATYFEFATQRAHPTIPLADGDRIVGIRNWDTTTAQEDRRTSHDVIAWRAQLKSLQDLGAFRIIEQNLIIDDGAAEPEDGAAVTASAFRLVQVPPLLGRTLVEADERPGAAAVVVIGHDVWRRRFSGDPMVVGRTVRLGRTRAVVVGVMPEGFEFPVAQSLWTPLSLGAGGERRAGPSIQVFGRLAPAATMAQAQSELDAVAAHAAADWPDTHARLRPEVVPYAQSIFDGEIPAGVLYAINLFFILFLVLVCANVAALILARSATRESEILVRTALGASRARIVTQLLIEALVLGGVAAVAGVALAGLELRWLRTVAEADKGRLPFWIHAGVSPATMLYVGVLTVLGAVIAGAGPARKVTRSIGTRLREAAAPGRGLGFGGVWTVVIVAQVAVSVALPAATFFVWQSVVRLQSIDAGIRADEYLSVRLETDGEATTAAAGFQATLEELQRRVAAEPGVIGATFADELPRTRHALRRIEVDNGAVPADAEGSRRLSIASVALDFFEAMESPIVAGRGFHAGDLTSDSRVVIVNRSFVQRVLHGANPIGRRVRYPAGADRSGPPGPWHEIVGVVRDLGMIGDDLDGTGLYHPLAPGAANPVYLAVHLRGNAASFGPRLRTIATAVDPTVRLRELLSLDEVGASGWLEFDSLWRVLAFVSAVALLLALAGIYSVMAFTVSRRTREIGIRIALGADGRGIVAVIFARALAQVGIGIGAGGVLVFLPMQLVTGLTVREVAAVTAYMVLMMGVCGLACIVPTRRALAVEPTQALRGEVS